MTLDVPKQSFADTAITISARGARPRVPINFTLKTKDALGNTWASNVICRSDAHGTVNVSVCAPQMKLFWSMQPMGGSPALFDAPSTAQATYELKAFDGAHKVGDTTFARVYAAAGVQRIDLHGDVVGAAFIPSGKGKHPAVILIGGSGGGHPMDALAALLASRGYAALSIAYFREPSLPDVLVSIPIETVGRAIAWLGSRSDVDGQRIGVIGHSRGSELALLTGAYYPQVKSVVALAPSPLIWAGINPKDFMHPQSAWTYQGKPLAFVPADPSTFMTMRNDPKNGLSLLPMFAGSIHNIDSTPDAWIPIERTHGPILFVAGESDAMWPSKTFSQMAIARLKEKHHAYHDAMLTYPNAGHWMFESYIPADGRIILNNPQSPFAFGGTPQGDAEASAKSWPAIMQFLNATLK